MLNRLLQCLAKAVVKRGNELLLDLLPAPAKVLLNVAIDTLEEYRKNGGEGALQAEVQALAQAPAAQVRREVQAAVQAEAADLSAEDQEKITAYLTVVPDVIRRSLARPSDPTGKTVPGDFSLRRPEDLLRILPTRRPRFKPGERPLAGVDWVLEELVGVGGFGEVWKARPALIETKAPVALKFCLDPWAVEALRNEVGVLNQVMRHGRHPGVVALLQTYLSADPPCLEYEYIEGGDLAGLIQELQARGELEPDLVNLLLLDLAEVTASFHGANPPIVHGDLKPANILVQRNKAGNFRLRVTDFGIGGLAAAQAARQPARSRTGLLTDVVRGAYTPLYASPQQMLGEPPDPRDDVHALGVIWLQMLTGDLGMMHIPPEPEWRKKVGENGLSEEAIQLLASCIAPEAERRPDSAVVLTNKLRAFPIVLHGMKFAWVPPGAFLMGSDKDRHEKPAHRVTLSNGFYLGVYPVSQAQWREVMGYNPSKFLGDDRPVEMVSWNDCQEFCQEFATHTGKPIRLPTEAEWEYACRAGTNRDYYSGNGVEALRQVGWYDQNSEGQPAPVGLLAPNGWGLYDMHGNVWEWCQDWYGPYAPDAVVDPTGPRAGQYRVLRGGSWADDASACRTAFRGNVAPGLRAEWVGFRVCFGPV
jgi:formylglycine-generating enzyme required for sulfatase activity